MEGRSGVQPHEVFGCSLGELTYESFKHLVETHVGSEPLLWEAKGAELVEKKRTAALRKAVSAFANSIDGGFVFIGVENDGNDREVSLRASGARFPDDEPGRWVSNALLTFQLRPRPWFDVQQLSVPNSDGRQIAVVWVPPIAAPPCIADGSVYERAVGVSAPVQDPARLAEIYRRGQDRHEAARLLADLQLALMGNEAATIQVGNPGVYCGACIAPLHTPGLRRRLFTDGTYEAVRAQLEGVAAKKSAVGAEVTVTHSQHALNGTLSRGRGGGLAAMVRVGAEGYVCAATKGLGSSQFDALMATWELTHDLYLAVSKQGPPEHYLAAIAADNSNVARLTRGPLSFPTPDDPVRDLLGSEIDRAAGLFGWEDEPA